MAVAPGLMPLELLERAAGTEGNSGQVNVLRPGSCMIVASEHLGVILTQHVVIIQTLTDAQTELTHLKISSRKLRCLNPVVVRHQERSQINYIFIFSDLSGESRSSPLSSPQLCFWTPCTKQCKMTRSAWRLPEALRTCQPTEL